MKNISKNDKKTGKSKIRKVSIIISILVFVAIVYFVRLEGWGGPKKHPRADLMGEKIYYSNEIKNVSGEYGDLEIIPVMIQAKESYFDKEANSQDTIDAIRSAKNWIFNNTKIEDVRAVFENAGLDKETIDILINNSYPNSDSTGFITTPPVEILEGFTPETRAKLYTLIRNYEGNIMFNNPCHFNSPNPEEWFFQSELSLEVENKLKSLVYVRDNKCYITDAFLVEPLLKSPEEWYSLLSTLYRSPALDVYLKIKEGQDISKLVEYWGNLGREKYVKEKLEEIRDNPGGGKIDIEELLPYTARYRLNSFSSKVETKTNSRDCLWTMYNFFNDLVDERFSNDANKDSLFNQICKVPDKDSKLRLGDAILFKKDKVVIHGSIFIVDDIVYTKNGQTSKTSYTPFILSYYDKVVNLYGDSQNNMTVEYFKRIKSITNNLKVN